MILLGSVQRNELIKMFDRHVGRDKRQKVAAQRHKEAEERLYEEEERNRKADDEQQRARRPSRFEVIPAPDVLKLRELANNEMLPPQAKKSKETVISNNNHNASSSYGSLPTKSILKKTQSFSMKGSAPLSSSSPYSTITGSESRYK